MPYAPLSLLLAVLAFVPPVAAQGSRPDRQVALTFDDLPMTGASVCDSAHVREVTRRLTGVIESRGIAAAGLATAGRSCIAPALLNETLQRWRAAGAVVGNHTATHPDLNTTPIAEYLANIDTAQELIDASGTDSTRWFRAPYLHMGSDTARKQALARHLRTHGYRVAPVTVDNQEWVYAAVYADARSRGDARLAERITGAYLAHLEESMIFYEGLSRAVLGREIPQILLLHANLLNADLLGGVIEMFEGRGYRFVSLTEATTDSAYTRPDPYVGPRGLSWLQRWALEAGVPVPPEPREAEWVAEEFEATQHRDSSPGAAGWSQQAMSQEEAAIAAASAAFSAAYMAGDTAAVRELYTRDAVLLAPERNVHGARAAARYFAPSRTRSNLHHAMVTERLEISGDRAVDLGTWYNTWRIEGQESRTASGRYLVVWRKGPDGRWRIQYDMWHRPRG